MKHSLSLFFRLSAFFLAFLLLAAASGRLSAQESRAARGIQNRIEAGGGKVGADPAEAAAEPGAPGNAGNPKSRRERRARGAQGENAAAPNEQKEPEKPVKKEHDPVEIIGEPFMTYDHYIKGNSDLVNKNEGEADETADRPVTAVVADRDGFYAASAGKDSTIQLWYTYDFYAEMLSEMYGYSYDNDYDPTIGTGQVSPDQQNAQNGKTRGADAKTEAAAGRQGNARRGNNNQNAAAGRGADRARNTAPQAAGARPGQPQAGATAAARRSQNAAMRQTDPFRQQQTAAAGAGAKNSASYYSNTAAGYEDSYAFYSSRQGNLAVQIPTRDALKEQIAGEVGGKGKKKGSDDWFGGDPAQGWSKSSKKKRKPPTTLGKMCDIYERLNLMGEREGQGYSDMMSFTHELPDRDQIVFYTADYSGKICQVDVSYKKGKGFPYARKRGVKNAMWAVAVYPGYMFDYKHGVYRDLVAGANNNGNIYFWDAFSRKLLRAVTVSPSDDPKKQPVLDINFAPDCSVVTAGMDGCARVITVPAMEIVSLLKGHKGPIFSAVFDETGQYVLTGSKDKSACLWDTATGEIVAAFIGHTGAVRKVQFLNDRYILTCSDDKTARIWELPDEVSLSPSSEPEYELDENGNPVDEEGNPVDVSAKSGAGWGTSESSIEDELFAVDEEDEEEGGKPQEEGDENKDETEEDPAGTHADAQGANEDEVPEQSIADAPRGFEAFRFEGPSPVFSVSVNNYYLLTGCQDGKVRVWDLYPFLEKVSGVNNIDPNAEGADGQPPMPGMPGMPGLPPVPGQPQPGGNPPIPPAAPGGAQAPPAAGGR